MPTYSYACSECGHAFDIYQSFSDDALTVCPECGGLLRKKFNSVGVVFKGSGFYRTDSRKEGHRSTGSTSSSSSSSTSAKSVDSSSGSSEKSSAPAKPAASATSGASAS